MKDQVRRQNSRREREELRGKRGKREEEGKRELFIYLFIFLAGCIYVSWPGDPEETGRECVGGILSSHFVCFVR